MRQWDDMIARTLAAMGLACAVGAAVAVPTQAEQARLWDEVGRVAVKGPADVALLDQAVLHVPAGEIFVPQPQADRLLDLFGNPGSNPDMPGLILPRDPKASWFMPVRFQATGYIKDDDARTWNADEMLRSLETGTDEQNREREKAGVPAMEVTGWSEPPRYDGATHRLAWALSSRVAGAKDDAPRLVNYNTYALGRDGYLMMNLVTALSDLPALKPVAEQQLAALEFNAGKRYADFDAKTDRTAAYGLSTLIVGITQPRLGFIPAAQAFAAQSMKAILLAVVLLAAVAFIFWRRKQRRTPVPPFVHTVADAPGSARPAVDVDLGDDAASADTGRRPA
ncbi:DUF2167 domain-containing protein [Scleromatobacter humisilvae]|uniref:DUF2167 domain-containing protein n=1 Tax=Scleromatobacter humisilvae TaxID=2897159 RepID=A0A9X2C3H1_9BURK|nr:DUF2167 domain-containing protein [Scleromatobacter humisilvae]MCK9688204.1 DUF2167 domain-containing protein [Scleromatobacter humisilvae]